MTFLVVSVVFVVTGVTEVFGAPKRNLVAGLVNGGGVRHVTTQASTPNSYYTKLVPYVDLTLGDGSQQEVDSTPLYHLWRSGGGHNLRVEVQLDAAGVAKRVRYNGRWYGVGPPIWFWLVVTILALAATLLLLRSLMRRRTASAAASYEA